MHPKDAVATIKDMTDDRLTGGHWLTYAEAAECLGLTTEAVRALARRQKWDRRSPNAIGGQAWVLVPADRLNTKHPTVATNGQTGSTNGHSTSDQRSDSPSDRSRPPGVNGHNRGDRQALLVADDRRDSRRLNDDDRRAEDIVTVARELTEPLKDQIADLKERLATERERANCSEERAREAESRGHELQGRLDTAEARIVDKDATIADLRARLDEERTERRQTADRLAAAQERIAAPLTDQRPAAPPLPARRSWWRWRRAQSGA